MAESTNIAMLKPARWPWDAITAMHIRNQCRGWLTGNSNRIGIAEQIRWFYGKYRRDHNRGLMNLYLFRNDLMVFGYGITSRTSGRWTVTGCLIPEARGIGLGERLFRQLIDSIPDSEVWLDVFEDNYRALTLYKKLGFEQVGARGNIIVMRLAK